ncbi:M15 family metallopeptidase [Anaeromicropila populeti]|uniref:LD-carboxypeptidase LdcB, LAS superfamily n=1 Tax=Anaeromicropila populeti TaxID=37658 RepID=A0A1I6I6J3_9FIRM|nr:M15 family metallopeptidase [Anaeromicropila populeti]SFR62248.1 LD-carboxypeptidase LdcB, LAS superfamily [Anaeromicropila populeti]
MKKLIYVAGSFLLLAGGILFQTISSHSEVNHTSNNYEYYYNNDSVIKEDSSMELGNPTDIEAFVPATKMDLEPDSITVLVNKEYGLPEGYRPDDLVVPDILFNINYFHEKKMLRREASNAIEELFEAGEQEGLSLCGVSGFRSYERQEEIYEENLKTKGYAHTSQFSAVPGYSEHQTGLAMDVSTSSIHYRLDTVFSSTPEGKWLAENAYKFGFTIRYPEDKTEITGYAYEPWHIRYVGKELAKYLYDNNLTLEEYYNYVPNPEIMDDEDYGNAIDMDDTPVTKSTPVPTVKPTPSKTPKPEAVTVTPTPSSTPVPSVSPDVTKKPVITQEPANTPKTEEPTPTPVPSSTPVSSTEPENTPAPSISPDTEPEVSTEPEITLEPVEEITPTPSS